MTNIAKSIYRSQGLGCLATSFWRGQLLACCRWLLVFLVATTFTLVNTDTLVAQTVQQTMINREHQIKAAYLYNFARYIQWPEGTFKSKKAPFVIGIIGSDPITKDLQKIAKTRKVEEHPIEIKQFNTAKEVTPCQILFFSPSLDPYVQEKVLKKMAGQNVLLVGQTSNFLEIGGVIGFVVNANNDNKVRLVIDLKAVQRQKLKASAKLLRVAKVIK
jgi:hypothetical protein